jgi:hypothetical protein
MKEGARGVVSYTFLKNQKNRHGSIQGSMESKAQAQGAFAKAKGNDDNLSPYLILF